MRRPAQIMTLALLLAACGTDDGVEGESALPAQGDTIAADSLTAAQERDRRNRAVAESQLPGAGAVGRALDASDASRARAAAMDSVQ